MWDKLQMKTNNQNQLIANTFEEMSLSTTLLTHLHKLNIVKPTEVQMKTIPVAMTGEDLVGIAQTGSGKTLAFVLPLLSKLEKNIENRALILAPSREMAQQILKVTSDLTQGIPVSTALIIGGVPSSKQIKQLQKKPRLIIATPGRLNDHLVNNKLLLQNVEFIVIDEADRMLDMGFAPQLKNIQSTLRGKQQTLMFSATFNSTVEKIAQLFMNENAQIIRSSQSEEPVTELKQTLIFIEKFSKNDRLLDELNACKGSVLVFCGNQGSCERTHQYLKEYGFLVDMIHGGVTQGQRNRVIRQFRNGELKIVVSTDLLARGIDIPHVDYVINFDLPFQAEDFLHRIGRTARAGRVGTAITFITTSEMKMYHKIKRYIQDAKIVILDSKIDLSEKSKGSMALRSKDKKPINSKLKKKSEQKKVFNANVKYVDKPISKTIGNLNKPKRKNENASQNDKPTSFANKKRSDKYHDVPRSGRSKPSIWKPKVSSSQRNKTY